VDHSDRLERLVELRRLAGELVDKAADLHSLLVGPVERCNQEIMEQAEAALYKVETAILNQMTNYSWLTFEIAEYLDDNQRLHRLERHPKPKKEETDT